MKRRIFGIITALALCLSLLPTAAWAAEGPTADDVVSVETTAGTQTYTTSRPRGAPHNQPRTPP